MGKPKFAVAAVFLCISGAYGQSDTVHAQRLTYTSIDVPGVLITVVEDINNNGEMVGYSSKTGIGDGIGFTLSGASSTSSSILARTRRMPTASMMPDWLWERW